MDKYFEALQKSKGGIALSIADQVGYDGTADVLEKGKAAAMGEIREWNGIKYQKTPKGWALVKKQVGASKTEPEKKEDKTSEAKDMPKFHSEYAQQFRTLINSYEKGTLAEKKEVMRGLSKIEFAASNSLDSEEGRKVYDDCLAVRNYVSKPRGTTDFKTVKEIIDKTMKELKPESAGFGGEKGVENAQKGDTLIDNNGDEWEVLSEPVSEWEEVKKYDNGGMETIIEEEGVQGPFIPVKNKEGNTAVFAVDETREIKLKKSESDN